MIKKFIEKQFDDILGQNINDFDKFLKLFVLIAYLTTSLLATSKFQKYIKLAIEFIYNDVELNIKEDISLVLISSLLLVSIYYLLLVIASILRNIISSIIVNIHYLYVLVFKDYPESKIRRDYKYNHDIVFKFRVREYLEENSDERIQKELEKHDTWVNNLFDRKRNLMVIVILLIVNFILYQENLHGFTNLYWLIIATITFYAGIIPHDYLMLIYIRNNKIRK